MYEWNDTKSKKKKSPAETRECTWSGCSLCMSLHRVLEQLGKGILKCVDVRFSIKTIPTESILNVPEYFTSDEEVYSPRSHQDVASNGSFFKFEGIRILLLSNCITSCMVDENCLKCVQNCVHFLASIQGQNSWQIWPTFRHLGPRWVWVCASLLLELNINLSINGFDWTKLYSNRDVILLHPWALVPVLLELDS